MPTDFVRTSWNLFVLRQLNKAKRTNDFTLISYWKEMFV